MRLGVDVGVLDPRDPADDVGAQFERLTNQIGGARLPHDAILREGDDLDLDSPVP